MEDDFCSFERTIYNFDSATVENGFVELSEKHTLICFPPLSQELSTVPREVNIYLNKILLA